MSIRRKRSSLPSPRSPRIVSLRPPSNTSSATPARIANETSPLRGLPPIHCATKTSRPSATANSGRNHLDLVIRIEHLLHRAPEESGKGKRERQRRRVALLLDRIDRLPRHLDRRSELTLREPALASQLTHPILHPETGA